jgi:tetratricopeptide (TPR) repeat protein
MTDAAWKPLLEKAPVIIDGKPTGAENFLAVMLYEELEFDKALSIWKKEAEQGSVLALRNLACTAQWKYDIPLALDYMKKAFDIEKGGIDQAFAEEYLKLLLRQKEYKTMWSVYQSLPPSTSSSERVQVLVGYAAAQIGEFDFLERLFERDLAIIQEGETSLSDIWFYVRAQELAKKRGVPYTEELLKEVTRTLNPPVNIDFRMRIEDK